MPTPTDVHGLSKPLGNENFTRAAYNAVLDQLDARLRGILPMTTAERDALAAAQKWTDRIIRVTDAAAGSEFQRWTGAAWSTDLFGVYALDAEKGVANGIATLGSDGLLTAAQRFTDPNMAIKGSVDTVNTLADGAFDGNTAGDSSAIPVGLSFKRKIGTTEAGYPDTASGMVQTFKHPTDAFRIFQRYTSIAGTGLIWERQWDPNIPGWEAWVRVGNVSTDQNATMANVSHTFDMTDAQFATLLAKVGGEANHRWAVRAGGKHEWGPGGATPADTTLERFEAGILKGTVVDRIYQAILPAITTDVVISNIPQTYQSLLLVVRGRVNGTVLERDAMIRMNGDATASYNYQRFESAGATAGGTETIDGTAAVFGRMPSGGSLPDRWGIASILIPGYRSAGHKTFQSDYMAALVNTAGETRRGFAGGVYKATAAITSLNLVLNTGSWVTGSTFTIYGLR